MNIKGLVSADVLKINNSLAQSADSHAIFFLNFDNDVFICRETLYVNLFKALSKYFRLFTPVKVLS